MAKFKNSGIQITKYRDAKWESLMVWNSGLNVVVLDHLGLIEWHTCVNDEFCSQTP